MDEIQNQPNNLQTQIPNSVGALVLGILSIPFCLCYGIVGLILAIVALILASNGLKEYNNNPEAYTESSLKNLKAGRICAFIGLGLSILYFIITIIFIVIYGLEGMSTIPFENF